MDIKRIGKKIKQLRELRRMTQKKLGEFLNYSEAHVSRIESGERSIGLKDLHKIADIFDVSYYDFLNEPNYRNHFRAEKTDTVNLDEKIWEDFKKEARKQK